MGLLKSTERVANFLAEFCALYEKRQMLAGPLTLPMQRSEIADYLGLAGATVSRARSTEPARYQSAGTR